MRRTRLRNVAIGVCSSLFAVAVQNVSVKYTRSNLKATHFKAGDADDILCDNLKTGDILLTQRRWYCYEVPAAILIKLNQIVYSSDFDHAGIVVLNEDGIPFVLECCFSGYRLRPYAERVSNSLSKQIALIPLSCRVEMNSEQRSRGWYSFK